MSIPHFFRIATLVSCILIIAAIIIARLGWVEYHAMAVVSGVLVVFVMTLAVYRFAFKSLEENIRRFNTAVMGGMMLKMLGGIVSVVVCGVFFKAHLIPYVVGFFTGYFILTGFEVYGLMRKLRAVS